MEVCSESSNYTMREQLRCRKSRNLEQPILVRTSTANPTSTIPSIMQSTNCKSALSSLIVSTFSNNYHIKSSNSKKSTTNRTILLGLGCTAGQEVSVPGVIRSSADWEDAENTKKKNLSKQKNKKMKNVMKMMDDSKGMSVGVHGLWCGADNTSVDCVRPLSGSRGKIDLDKLLPSECGYQFSRERVNSEKLAALDLDSSFEVPHFGPETFEAEYYRHRLNRSPEGLAELLMFQNALLMGRRSRGLDRYRDLRLDVDSMTYEELLELGDRIGNVSTGLGEDQIGSCLRKSKPPALDEIYSQFRVAEEIDRKCSICQEEFEVDEEIGKLECGHAYHMHCIKQWLVRKNACPVCKLEACH